MTRSTVYLPARMSPGLTRSFVFGGGTQISVAERTGFSTLALDRKACRRGHVPRGSDVLGTALSDPLELHFRRMAEIPLLTREGEVALARRIERADLAISRLLLA